MYVYSKNAWGYCSYADLITMALKRAPSKQMTLAEIYDWIVANIPFFKDKGDANSSVGWKNSIRHNLSLHDKFSRVTPTNATKVKFNPLYLNKNDTLFLFRILAPIGPLSPKTNKKMALYKHWRNRQNHRHHHRSIMNQCPRPHHRATFASARRPCPRV